MTPMSELSILHGMRLQLDALIAEKEGQIASSHPQPDPDACPNCGAPAEKQVETSTLDGTKSVICIACKVARPT